MAKINGTTRKDDLRCGFDRSAPCAKGWSRDAGVLTGDTDPIGTRDAAGGMRKLAPRVRAGYQVEAVR